MSTSAQSTTLLEGAVQDWYDEIADYDYEHRSCTSACGHYTQVVWATTTTLGCGTKRCGADTNAGVALGGRETTILVCNYAPPGNTAGQKPYIAGETCAACPDSCEDGLCTSEAASCVDSQMTLEYNRNAYSDCSTLVADNQGICGSWAAVGSTYCRLSCGTCVEPARTGTRYCGHGTAQTQETDVLLETQVKNSASKVVGACYAAIALCAAALCG